MPVFRVEKTADFTVMSNHHLRNRQLSLRAKGLLSQMLSLPPDWDYTLAGLAAINLEGIDAVREAVRELEKEGYITREQQRGDRGRFSNSVYVIREVPSLAAPSSENPTSVIPISVKPTAANPTTGPPVSENPRELNREVSNTEELNTDCINYPINQICDRTQEADAMRKERELYRELIRENISYECFSRNYRDREDVDEIVEIMLDTVCSTKPIIVIRGEEMPREVVKSRLLKLDSEHIRYVLDCIRSNTTKIRNIKQYILACLYNAPATISNYYTTLVQHDMYGGI